MPKYSNLPIKREARQANIDIYREYTGEQFIPEGRSYWTLCNEQPPEDGSEIVQLETAGFLTKNQFYGVDLNPLLIAKNKIWHPEANWITGDWLTVIREHADFNPSMIYLDTTYCAAHWTAHHIVLETMSLCPHKTLLLVNVMMNNPRGREQFDKEALYTYIQTQLPLSELEHWGELDVCNYQYNATGKTTMRTYGFYKR